MSKGGGQPAATTQTTTSEFPSELRPYVTDILERAKAQAEREEEKGFQPYTGPRIAEFEPEQLQSQQAVKDIVSGGVAASPGLSSAQTYYTPALGLTLGQAQRFGAPEAAMYMSPYQQAVIDVEKREAVRQFQPQMQQIGASAVGAGGFGGSRQAILEAEAQRNLQQRLGDIQTRGLQQAYDRGQAAFEAQKARERGAAGSLAQMGAAIPAQALKEVGALESVGAERQQMAQRALDLGYSQFREEQMFPTRTLQEYQSIIRGFPFTPSTYSSSQYIAPPASLAQNVLGIGTGIAGLAGAFGGFKEGGTVKLQEAGKVDEGNFYDFLFESKDERKERMKKEDPDGYGAMMEKSIINRAKNIAKLSPRKRQAELERLRDSGYEGYDDLIAILPAATAGAEGVIFTEDFKPSGISPSAEKGGIDAIKAEVKERDLPPVVTSTTTPPAGTSTTTTGNQPPAGTAMAPSEGGLSSVVLADELVSDRASNLTSTSSRLDDNETLLRNLQEEIKGREILTPEMEALRGEYASMLEDIPKRRQEREEELKKQKYLQLAEFGRGLLGADTTKGLLAQIAQAGEKPLAEVGRLVGEAGELEDTERAERLGLLGKQAEIAQAEQTAERQKTADIISVADALNDIAETRYESVTDIDSPSSAIIQQAMGTSNMAGVDDLEPYRDSIGKAFDKAMGVYVDAIRRGGLPSQAERDAFFVRTYKGFLDEIKIGETDGDGGVKPSVPGSGTVGDVLGEAEALMD